jgi:hypothetical protein
MKDIVLDSYSKGKQSDFISSLYDEKVGASENFWEFKDAFSESGSIHKSVSHFDLNSLFCIQC